MADPVLTDAKSFRFKDLDLSGNLVSWNDAVMMRVAQHKYLKRDGGEMEPMGAEPMRFTMRLCFLGDSWARNYRALVASIRKDPRGQLVHPLLGTIRVFCEGIPDAGVDPGRELNSINFSLSFLEDSVDATTTADSFVGPAAQQGKVSNLAAQVVTAVSGYVSAIDAAAQLAADSTSFAIAAVAAATTDTPDPSVDARLANVSTGATATIDAVRADPAAASDARIYGVIVLVEALLAACNSLSDAIAASKPVIVTYVVPARTNVAAIAARFYGKDALARLDEIVTLNRIANPHAILAGTRLRLATPTL